jgi:hypothetical protein
MKIKQPALFLFFIRIGGILWLFLSLSRMMWIKEPYKSLRGIQTTHRGQVMHTDQIGYMDPSSKNTPASVLILPIVTSSNTDGNMTVSWLSTNFSHSQIRKTNRVNVTSKTLRYMSRRAIILRREVEFSDAHNQRIGRNYPPDQRHVDTRISPYPLHFVTYATPDMNLTLQRILRQAERSQFFVTVTGLGPDDLPPEFLRDYQDILLNKPGGGYYLWRYPVWEIMMQRVPWNEYVMYLDAGCTILSTGRDTLLEWLRRLEISSQPQQQHSNQNSIHEIMRFPEAKQFRELRWTTDAVLNAFGLNIDGPQSWSGAMKPQLFGGLLLVKNGVQWRNLTALIYKVLDQDPYLITDRYTNATLQRRPGRFTGFRHDQSISSVASKILQTHILAPDMELWGKNINGTFIKPPFGVTRFRYITNSQLDTWTRECQDTSREMDDHCDHLANKLFELNSIVE